MKAQLFLVPFVLGLGSAPAAVEEPAWFTDLRAAYTAKVKAPKDQPPQPPVETRWPGAEYNYGEWKFPWSGVSIVWDAVNGEALFLGGHHGGMPFGTLGSWALSDGGTTWRELKWPSPILDPLRTRALDARRSAKASEAAARRIFYTALDARKERDATKDEPAKLAAESLRLAEELTAMLSAKEARGWEKQAIEQAAALTTKAVANLRSAQAAFASGRLDAATLRTCFEAQWTLDEAADCLASSPPPREQAATIFDPASRSVVLFGGSHHDFMYADTWLYDCAQKTWRQIWPKQAPTARMGATFSIAGSELALTGGQTVLNKMTYQKGEMPVPSGKWTFDLANGAWIGEGGGAAGARIYRTIVPGYDPRWYDAAPRGDRAATEAWLAALPPNVWTEAPAPPAPAPERDWGTAVFDPDRDCIYRWTGGHCADPASQPSTYHPVVNRWSIPFVPDIIASRKGMTFTGRPDCSNHTYLHYAYDPIARRLICPSDGGTGVFDPDTGDFEFSVAQPFNRHIYETCATGTPRGVVLWAQGGKFFVFDYANRAWRSVAVTGKPPRPVTDGSTLCYDARRDALWMASFHGYQKPSGNIWRLDLKSGAIAAMNPVNGATLGVAKGFDDSIRESIYLPDSDLVLFNNFTGGRQIAYDPNGNRWVTLNIAKNLKRLGSVSDTLTWDAKRKLVWNLNAYQAIYVLRLDAATLEVSDESK